MPLTELAQLNAIDRMEALQILAASFGDIASQGNLHRPAAITHTPDVCGGDACLAGTRIPVWLLLSLRRQGASDAELLQFYPHLSATDLLLAQAYAIAYPEEMEAALQRQAIADASE